jgi:RimJ/RimL family protein N-acetyltransferase
MAKQTNRLGVVVPDWHPRPRPDGRTMEGRFARVERLDAARHGPSLWKAVRDNDRVWDYLPYGPFATESDLTAWLAGRAKLADPFYYTVTDHCSGQALGCLTLMEIRPEMGVLELGHIFYSPALQRTPASTETFYLVARYVFDDLGYRRFEWKCNDLNDPSKFAALRFGFTFEGVFRQHLVVKGRNRDTAWYSMLDSEWPLRKATFERWLSPDNFDPNGRQKLSLSQMMGVGSS